MGGLFGIALSHGDGSRGLIRVSGESALLSSCSIIILTCVGSLVILMCWSHGWVRDLLVQCNGNVFFFRRSFKDGFEGISWFSNEHLEKCRAIFVVATYVGMFEGDSCRYSVSLVAS